MSSNDPTPRHAAPAVAPPGTEKPRRFRPALRYELIGCGLHGHELLGTEAARLRPEDHVFAREAGGLRWYRCLRCDSWLPLPPPAAPAATYPPHRDEVELPLRGRALHFLVLAAIAVAVLLFAHDKATLNAYFNRVLTALQGGLGGPVRQGNHGVVHDLQHLFAVSTRNLYLLGIGIAAYAVLEGVEAIGLWRGRRWAEYLTLLATAIFVPYEVYELTKTVTALKVLTLIINVAIVVYLLFAKRLFGLRGGGRAEQAERERDAGWAALERATPVPSGAPAHTP
jgi:uncharacterized membrane protein (DUF2068 family)